MAETNIVTLAIPTITATDSVRGAANLRGAMTVLAMPTGIRERREGPVREAARYVGSHLQAITNC
jgi:hypothetical protein